MASVNVATVAVTALPSVALTFTPAAARSASTTVAVLVTVAVLPPSSLMVTLIGSFLLSSV